MKRFIEGNVHTKIAYASPSKIVYININNNYKQFMLGKYTLSFSKFLREFEGKRIRLTAEEIPSIKIRKIEKEAKKNE